MLGRCRSCTILFGTEKSAGMKDEGCSLRSIRSFATVHTKSSIGSRFTSQGMRVESIRLLRDGPVPPLQVGIPHRTVQVNGRLFNALEQFQVLRPGIDAISTPPPKRSG